MSLRKGTKQVSILTKIPAALQEKDIVIKENGTTTVVPDDKYEGINKVIINTQVAGGSGSKNGYTMPTVVAMKEIKDASVDDKCVVLKSSIAKMTSTTTTQYITFPTTVTLDSAVTDSIYSGLESKDGSGIAGILLDKNRFIFDVWDGSGNIRVLYTSEDGIKYSMTQAPETNPVDLGVEMQPSESEWDDVLGNFMLVGSTDFGGIYNYNGSDWDTQSIALNIGRGNVVKDIRYYDDGFAVGMLGDTGTKEGSQNLNDFLIKYATNINWPTDMSNYFSNYNKERIVLLELNPDTSNVTNMAGMFHNCSALITIPQLDTNKVTNMSDMFNYCQNLTAAPLLDTSNVTNMAGMFYACSKLKEIPPLNTAKVTDMNCMLNGCQLITTIPTTFDTRNVTNMKWLFRGCSALVTIPILNAANVENFSDTFEYDSSLVNLGGFTDAGMAFSTTQSANYHEYAIELSSATNLTYDSLMNVINNLYNIKTKGVQPQQLRLGSTNLAKLTSEEIAIATNKGWTVS